MRKILLIPLILVSVGLANPALASGGGASANSAGVQEILNAATNGAIAAANAPPCFKTPPNVTSCILMALGFAQLAMSMMQSGGSFDGRDVLAPGVDWSLDPGIIDNDSNPIPGHLDDGWFDPIKDAMKTGQKSDYENAMNQLKNKSQGYLDKLEKMGYKVDMNTGMVTGPNGPIDPSSVNFSDAAAEKYLAGLAGKLGELDTSGGGGMIASGAGGAGAGFGRGLAGDDDESGSKSGVDDFLKKLKNGEVDGSKLSGMSKGMGNDRIGVAMNNIFRMIQVKYTSIDKDRKFLEKK